MKNRAIALAMCIVMLLLSGCSTNRYYGDIKERSDGLADAYTQDISPRSQGNAYGDEVSATLYFRYLSEELLAGVEREFHVTAESMLEEMVVQALIDGPQDASYQYNALINPDTELIAVKEQSGYLSVTLSGEFVEKMDEDIIADALRRRLAVLSIVNSVTSIGNYSRVLILIDDDNNGIGERMTYAEAGWEDMGEITMEPMALDAAVILTPENVIDIVMTSLVEKDYGRIEYYLAGQDYDGTARPGYAEVTAVLKEKSSVVGYERSSPAIISGDGKRAVVTLTITYIDQAGKTAEVTDIPVRLLHEGVWKISFASLQDMFPEY